MGEVEREREPAPAPATTARRDGEQGEDGRGLAPTVREGVMQGERTHAAEGARTPPVSVREVSADDESLAALIARLDGYLAGLYPADEIFGVDFSDPATRNMVFAVAYLDGRPVGCGGIRSLDASVAELKRFYVEPDVRRAGIAGKVYRHLEKRAAELGHKLLRLETGAPQFESIRFYRKQGFYEIERFGEYADCESSYCMEKPISP